MLHSIENAASRRALAVSTGSSIGFGGFAFAVGDDHRNGTSTGDGGADFRAGIPGPAATDADATDRNRVAEICQREQLGATRRGLHVNQDFRSAAVVSGSGNGGAGVYPA